MPEFDCQSEATRARASTAGPDLEEIALAKAYRRSPTRKFINRIVRAFDSIGLGARTTYMLTVTGRKSGLPRTTPITAVVDGDTRWLVAPYGDVEWVKNARVAGRVTLTRGRRSETVGLTELGPVESAPVLKTYVQNVAITRPYFDARPDSPLEDFVAEASRHPVFLVRLAGEPAAEKAGVA
jgi:deazaflavin-dependent oxidoreductase (nitroreductase family)